MISRKKANNTNSTWEPFATSTPVRIIPDKTKTDGLPQKQFTKGKDAKGLLLQKTYKTLNNGQGKQASEQIGHISKKFKRNRSNFYFDVSSSSSEDEDSCLSSNGPTIKISLEGSTNMKSNSKNSDSKKKVLVSPKNNIIESNKIMVDDGVNPKCANNKASEKGKPDDEVTTTSEKLESKIKLPHRRKNSSYNYEDKHKENKLKEKKNTSHDKSNNSSKNSEKSKDEMVDLNRCESRSSTEELDRSNQQYSVHPKSKKNVNNKNQNLPEVEKSVSYKLKRTKPITDVDPIDKKRVKTSEIHSSDNKSPTDEKKPQPKIKSYRKDSSHQLFSDSMHQELINSLDLTTAELDNLDQVFESPWKMTPNKTLPKRSKPKGKVVRNINFSPKKSTRHRQPPKEFWMPRNDCDLLHKVTDDLNNKNNNENGDADSASQYPYFNEVQNEKGRVLKKAEKVNTECIKATTKKVNTMSNTKKLGFPENFPNKDSEGDGNQLLCDDNKENNAKMDQVDAKKLPSLPANFPGFFKQLPTFENCVDGIEAAECWALRNFKCGILRVQNQCQISDKTKFKNSYFGGILIKGSLKMTIGGKDCEINEGDMAFVPPLTEWCVIGNHESESLFYYWCARFKS